MFSKKIVSSDAFLDMSIATQALYFHLGMEADDDGFVNPKKIMKMIGSSDDDLKVLLSKRFILPFENGVVVIKHWLINNLIRKDFYQPTMYLEQKSKLNIKDNKSYTELDKNECLQNVNNLDTQYRIGKDRLGKDRIDNTGEQSSQIPVIIDLFKEINPSYKKWFGNKTQRSACERMLKVHGIEKLTKIIPFLKVSNKERFCAIATTPLQLEDKYAQIEAFWQKKFSSQPLINI